jgi:hypothetical protein
MCNTLKQDDGVLKRDDTLKKDGQDTPTTRDGILYLSTETRWKHTKTRWMPNRNYCRQMEYALEKEGNKLKQNLRKWKHDEIRLSGGGSHFNEGCQKEPGWWHNDTD